MRRTKSYREPATPGLGALALVSATAAAGCTGIGEITHSGGDAGADANLAAAAARAAFDQDVRPLLDGFCGACHSTPGVIGFLVPAPEVYDSVRGWPELVDVGYPAKSRLLTQGAHDGPAWTLDQAPILAQWIELEATAAGIEPIEEPETAAFAPIVGINTIDLGPIGLPGTTITFRLEMLGVGFYLSELMINPGASGAHIVHPLFVTWVDGVPTPDPVDRFAGLEMTVQLGQSAMLGGGTLVLVDVPPTAQLSLHFAVAEPAVGGPGDPGGDPTDPGGGGCKNVPAFTANAQPVLSASCAGCHAGGNMQATSATDMTAINDLSPTGQAAACGQILSRVNLADAINSGVFIAPDPNSGAGHPFKFGGNVAAFQSFENALLVWIAQE
jgi:cytochrome c553